MSPPSGAYRWKPYAEMPEHLRDGREVLLWCEGWPVAESAHYGPIAKSWWLIDDEGYMGYMTCDPDYYCEMIEPPRSMH
jgi:hypothetical protein